MKTSIALLFLMAATALAQTPAYVAYDGARLYAEPDYLSDVIDTLALGDTLATLEREKKFVHVSAGEKEGWVLAANIAERPPRSSVRTKSAHSSTAPAGTAEGGGAKAGSSEAGTTTAGVSEANASEANASEAGVARSGGAEGSAARGGAPSGGRDEATGAQCAATTKTGRRCSRKASAGSAYCWQHAK